MRFRLGISRPQHYWKWTALLFCDFPIFFDFTVGICEPQHYWKSTATPLNWTGLLFLSFYLFINMFGMVDTSKVYYIIPFCPFFYSCPDSKVEASVLHCFYIFWLLFAFFIWRVWEYWTARDSPHDELHGTRDPNQQVKYMRWKTELQTLTVLSWVVHSK